MHILKWKFKFVFMRKSFGAEASIMLTFPTLFLFTSLADPWTFFLSNVITYTPRVITSNFLLISSSVDLNFPSRVMSFFFGLVLSAVLLGRPHFKFKAFSPCDICHSTTLIRSYSEQETFVSTIFWWAIQFTEYVMSYGTKSALYRFQAIRAALTVWLYVRNVYL